MAAIAALVMTGLILAFGILCIKVPERAIEMQRKFYAKINWRIQPISVAKELKNTRMMGKFMAVVAGITMVLVILKVLK
jgi:hypothetical protein